MERLSPVQQRALAVGLLVLLLAAVYGVLVAPLIAKSNEYGDTIADLEQRLTRYRQVVARKSVVSAQLKRMQSDLAAKGHFIRKDTPALASAELQQQIKEMISASGGQLNSTQVVPARQEDSFTRVAIKVHMLGTIEVFEKVLYDIESARPLLMVDDLQIRPLGIRRARRGQQARDTGTLDLRFEVVGYMRAASS
jgi:general secretion pathway protein M